MNKHREEVLFAVDKINEEIYQKYKKKNDHDQFHDHFQDMPVISATFAGYVTLISISIPSKFAAIPEINLYCSEDNDRIYYEKSNTYESYYKFIKRKFREVKTTLNNVKL